MALEQVFKSQFWYQGQRKNRPRPQHSLMVALEQKGFLSPMASEPFFIMLTLTIFEFVCQDIFQPQKLFSSSQFQILSTVLYFRREQPHG